MRTMIVLHSLSDEQIQSIQLKASDWRIICGDDKGAWLPHLQEAEIICGWKPEIAEQCLSGDTKLKWVQAWGAGVEKLPLEELNQHGILVTTASGVHPIPTSETVFAMMLSFSRKVHHSVRNQVNKRWQPTSNLGEIHGKTIGIVGVGAIGAEIARLAKAFEMNVLGVRRTGYSSANVDQMFDIHGLRNVLEESDYVVVTTPLTNQTRHMFSWEQFRVMKRSAYYINIGRGGTTHTEALIAALQGGEIAGAGLDVFEQEPLPVDNPLWDMDNVIITPHNGGITDQYHNRAVEILLINLGSYLEGKEPTLNLVNLIEQY